MRGRIGNARMLTIVTVAAMLAGLGGSGVLTPVVASGATVFTGPTDLGTLGGTTSNAVAVSGSIVAGNSDTTENAAQHAFAYDAAAASPHMIDLGTLGGTTSNATAVSGSVVVGWSYSIDSVQHAFAYDLADASPHMIDLDNDTLGGRRSFARAVSGHYVVGTWVSGIGR